MSHTPGPWRAEADTMGYEILSSSPEMSATVAFITARPSVTGKADADLIAAAPDLLAAAKAVLAQFSAGMFQRNTDYDFGSDWAIKAAGPLRDLAALKAAVDRSEGMPYRVKEFTE
jgi:hypothetical protein